MSGPQTTAADVHTRELYLELLKRAVSHTLYGRSDVGRALAGRNQITRAMLRFFDRRGFTVLRDVEDAEALREEGRDWPLFGQTMIGRKRLDNVQHCVEDVIERGVPGDLIETGVWRGGATILMRAVLAAHGVTDRTVWVADSFEGLPAPPTSAIRQIRARSGTPPTGSPSRSRRCAATSSATGCSTTRCASWWAGSRTRCGPCPIPSGR